METAPLLHTRERRRPGLLPLLAGGLGLFALVAWAPRGDAPATLAAAEWEDTKAGVDDALLRAAVDAEDAAVTAVVRLAGDGGRAKAIAEAEDAAAARPRTVKPGPKRLAFSDLLSKANRAGK